MLLSLGVLAAVAQQCSGHSHGATARVVSRYQRRLADTVFVHTPRGNALLATVLLQCVPPAVALLAARTTGALSSGTTATAFALGTLLGDVFLHLIPHCDPGSLGVGLFAGFVAFLALDRVAAVLQGGATSHSHSHSHSHVHGTQETQGEHAPSLLLNVISDAAHNATDGIALASAFYKSSNVGAVTALAIAIHEIPHAVADFAVLRSKSRWVRAKLATLLLAVVGTALGCHLNEHAAEFGDPARLTLPVTAGGLLYIAATGLLPQLREGTATSLPYSRVTELRAVVVQLLAVTLGFLTVHSMHG
ncbi:Zn(2+) transporter YKE4 KNAG_0H02840 [Huiozyma naganishii CBS 8797]|uniref:Uncharacterized protein n=1 Tax=Huiozyma naganishii (strain ATCC MYA-139 / BCRC 22969 / CBS 8797 / KCTC 17520 / NBRC 10181 / NCYC 3082 / Yp74L-3) TaxID=1071383 RepID=J7S8R4_HUIN7|nr:hypothetical protein KNAG_0H02840 [Kazachstania naganishii CBS 8797]CCK71699.1 hypothetical protein KNAG_0H02840 [Kazachstania naganishii CBS 8797]